MHDGNISISGEFEFVLEGLDLENALTFSDLKFERGEHGVLSAVISFFEKEENGNFADLQVVEHAGKRYSIGQIVKFDVDTEETQFRNVRMFMDEFSIPGHLSVANNMIGPTNAMQVLMIMKLVKATFFKDFAERNQMLDQLNLGVYQDRFCESAQVLNIAGLKR